MGKFIDLRKHNITSEEDAIEFLELFEAKVPQLIDFMRRMKFKRVSLQNRLIHANSTQQAVAEPGTDASVLDRMTGVADNKPATDPAQSRLEQLRAAQNAPTPDNATSTTQNDPNNATPTADDELPPPPAPGEIGQLHLPIVDPKAPDGEQTPAAPATNVASADTNPPSAPTNVADGGTSEPATASEEAAEQAAGSKSELPTDNDVQPQNPESTSGDDSSDELTEEERKALEEPKGPSAPTEEDKTSIGTKIARRTKGKGDNAKK